MQGNEYRRARSSPPQVREAPSAVEEPLTPLPEGGLLGDPPRRLLMELPYALQPKGLAGSGGRQP